MSTAVTTLISPSTLTSSPLPYALLKEELLQNKVPILDKKVFQTSFNNEDGFFQSTPPQVEFELRHAYEHLEKLKFNWLELQTKREFLEALVDKSSSSSTTTSTSGGDFITTMGTPSTTFSSRWCPAELKQLEDEIGPIKLKLKEDKSKTTSLIDEIELSSMDLISLEDSLSLQYEETISLISALIDCEDETQATLKAIREIECDFGIGSISGINGIDNTLTTETNTSPQELDLRMQELQIESSSVADCINRQKESITDLERLLSLIDDEIATTQNELDDFKHVVDGDGDGDGNDDSATTTTATENNEKDTEEDLLHGLCDWYQEMLNFISKLTNIKGVEMIRPDYLLVQTTTNGRTIHIHLSPSNAALSDVRISTLRPGDEMVIKEAIERNNIPFLLRNL